MNATNIDSSKQALIDAGISYAEICLHLGDIADNYDYLMEGEVAEGQEPDAELLAEILADKIEWNSSLDCYADGPYITVRLPIDGEFLAAHSFALFLSDPEVIAHEFFSCYTDLDDQDIFLWDGVLLLDERDEVIAAYNNSDYIDDPNEVFSTNWKKIRKSARRLAAFSTLGIA